MGIFTGLFKSRDKPKNSYDSPSYSYFFGRSNSGKRVSDRTALQHTVVYACVRVLSEAIASLPLHIHKYPENVPFYGSSPGIFYCLILRSNCIEKFIIFLQEIP